MTNKIIIATEQPNGLETQNILELYNVADGLLTVTDITSRLRAKGWCTTKGIYFFPPIDEFTIVVKPIGQDGQRIGREDFENLKVTPLSDLIK